MKFKKYIGISTAGLCAGAVTGLFGGGGGMVLVPLLTILAQQKEDAVFPTSVSIILPICLVTIGLTVRPDSGTLITAAPYLIGSVIGGVLAGIFGRRIPTIWLHRTLGLLIIWGGIRYLC